MNSKKKRLLAQRDQSFPKYKKIDFAIFRFKNETSIKQLS